MATKNIILSIILTLVFIIFVTLTHEKSSCCILPSELKTKNKKKQKKIRKKKERSYNNYRKNSNILYNITV